MSATAIPATAIDVYRSLPEGTRCEVLYNQLNMTPAPSINHQRISVKISSSLFAFLEKKPVGEIFEAPVDVYLESYQSVIQPDVLVVMNENKSIIREDGIYGTPDIVVEILSGNRMHDTLKKKALYEEAGVKEYFIVDPLSKNVMLFTYDDDKHYTLAYEIKGKLTSEVLGYSFDL